MNIGISLTKSPYLCLCNNDLRFHEGWASEIVKYMQTYSNLFSASPICSLLHPHIGIPLDDGMRWGYRVGYELAGWCLFIKRALFKQIGKLDENYIFSASDNDYSNTLRVCNIKHALITSSIVDHLRGKTLFTQNDDRQGELLTLGTYYFKKWAVRLGNFATIDLIIEPKSP
jgi:GT2 family glycosyltransferase